MRTMNLTECFVLTAISATTTIQGIRGAADAPDPSSAGGYSYLALLGIGLSLCTIILIGLWLYGMRKSTKEAMAKTGTNHEPRDTKAKDRLSIMVVLLFGYILLIPLIGFIAVTIIFCTLFLRLFGKNSWISSIAFGMIISGSFYCILVKIAKMPLPHSLIGF